MLNSGVFIPRGEIDIVVGVFIHFFKGDTRKLPKICCGNLRICGLYFHVMMEGPNYEGEKKAVLLAVRFGR